ncbi:hypothetical protein G4X40_19910 [Rhodococcus sp. D2-41]|uniref:WhiB family transcriptional regulator n=1 Tax=Speluncibacter jeojiensis TaxID=2710754 RepID=UPI0024108BDF|nr:WhiB family transcriptional regulator [Rhodococcus sp. D2-41]MDG3012409.1 hypothetical protein [Rhodococcus sp. D2-41]
MTTYVDWRNRGRCAGQDPERWVIENLPLPKRDRPAIARQLCAGCPTDVQLACLRNAVEMKLTGMVVAGQMIETTWHLQQAAADAGLGDPPARSPRGRKQTVQWPRPCQRCNKSMRPSRSTRDVHPGTVMSSNKNQCLYCMSQIRAEAAAAAEVVAA